MDGSLQAFGLTVRCLGVNVKEKDKIRVIFRGDDHPTMLKEADKWARAMAPERESMRVYGEQ